MGFFSNLDTEAYDREYSDRDLLKRIVSYLKPHTGRLVGISLFLILIGAASASLPLVVSSSIDRLTADQADSQIKLLIVFWYGSFIYSVLYTFSAHIHIILNTSKILNLLVKEYFMKNGGNITKQIRCLYLSLLIYMLIQQKRFKKVTIIPYFKYGEKKKDVFIFLIKLEANGKLQI